MRSGGRTGKQLMGVFIFILLTGLILSGCSVQDTHTANEGNGSEQQSSIAESPDNVEEGTDNEEENIIPSSEVKDLTWKSEGVPYTEPFKLIDASHLPFTTYIPEEDWTAISIDNGVVFKFKHNGQIKVVFLDKGTTQQDAEQYFQKIVNQYPEIYEEKDDTQSWVILSYHMYDKTKGDVEYWKYADAILGERNNQYLIIIWGMDNFEYAEVFYPMVKVVFKQWRWRDTDELLGILVLKSFAKWKEKLT